MPSLISTADQAGKNRPVHVPAELRRQVVGLAVAAWRRPAELDPAGGTHSVRSTVDQPAVVAVPVAEIRSAPDMAGHGRAGRSAEADRADSCPGRD